MEIPQLIGDCFASAEEEAVRENMWLRRDEFAHPDAYMAAALALANPAKLWAKLSDHFSIERSEVLEFFQTNPFHVFPEVIIGGGLHSAVWASTMAGVGGQPLVIESDARPGGIFNSGPRPVFYLNSRNRPECDAPRLPGTPGPLNTLMNSPLQVSDISTTEYPTNLEMALVIMLNLAMHARVVCGRTVEQVKYRPDLALFELTITDAFGGPNSNRIRASNVINATGLGAPKDKLPIDPRILTFNKFVRRMASQGFPLRNWKNVCVFGANDSGNVVVEYLLGMGPPTGLSVPRLDWVENITWVGQTCKTKEQFEANARSRYAGIGRYMPREGRPDYYSRVDPVEATVTRLEPRREGVLVRFEYTNGVQIEELYDHVVSCTGFEPQPIKYKGFENPNVKIPVIGPAAQRKLSDEERKNPALANIPENSAAIFRYTEDTAATAISFGAREPSGIPPIS